jgi:hypothetical protein
VSAVDNDSDPVDPPPSRTKGEIGGAVVRAAISTVPVFGAPAAELVNLVLQPALGRRREKWLRDLAETVEDMRRRFDGFDPHELEENELFITTVISATNAALRTHETEKLRALRNAVISSALPMGLGDYEQLTFIRYVDELTGLHLRLMTYLSDPTGWFDRHGIEKPSGILSSSGERLLEIGMPELAGHQERYRQALGDLGTRGLADAGAMSGMVTEQGLWVPRTTAIGNRFLAYISDPADEADQP